MKKFLLLYCTIIACAFVFIACDDEVDYPYTSLEGVYDESAILGLGNVKPESNSFTLLDYDSDIVLTYTTVDPSISVSSMDVYQVLEIEKKKVEKKVATPKLGSGSATFNIASILAGSEDTEEFDLKVTTTLSSGESFDTEFSLNVVKPVSLNFADDHKSSDIIINDTIEQTLGYSTDFFKGKPDDVELKWKKNKAGTWTVDSEFVYNSDVKKQDSIFLHSLDYINRYSLVAGDTLYYAAVARRETVYDGDTISIPIIGQDMGDAVEIALDSLNESSSYNLDKDKFIDLADTDEKDMPEIQFLDQAGITVYSEANLDLVQLTAIPGGVKGDKYFKNEDGYAIASLFESGSKVKSLTGLKGGDLISYKVERVVKDKDDVEEDVTKYGLILVGDTFIVNDTISRINVSYKEGTVIVPKS